MSEKTLNVDKKPHELKLGASFDKNSRIAFHSIRYDFKPASVDTGKDSLVEVGEGNHVTLTVPHVEGSGKTHTVYKGNKRPCPKECVLIIDHETGTFTLERLSNTLQLKKTRIEHSKKVPTAGRPLTPVDYNKQKASPSKAKPSSQGSPPSQSISPVTTPKVEKGPSPIGSVSDSSSSDSDSDSDSSNSDSDSDSKAPTKSSTVNNSLNSSMGAPKTAGSAVRLNTSHNSQTSSAASNSSVARPKFMSTLSQDLQLSESSDDDSD